MVEIRFKSGRTVEASIPSVFELWEAIEKEDGVAPSDPWVILALVEGGNVLLRFSEVESFTDTEVDVADEDLAVAGS